MLIDIGIVIFVKQVFRISGYGEILVFYTNPQIEEIITGADTSHQNSKFSEKNSTQKCKYRYQTNIE